MDKLAQNLDLYDDPKGAILRKRFPDPSNLPGMFKEGALLSQEERDRLPDSLFALVVRTKEASLRKFPCTDKANTGMSIVYFLDHAQPLLPAEFQKTAARNLVTACHWYGIDPPQALAKLAGTDQPADSIDPVVEMSMVKPVEEQSKQADYCLPEQQKYPLNSYRQVQEAVAYFEKNAHRFEPRTRRTYCKNLEKRASEIGLDLPEVVRHYASTTPAEPGDIYEQITRRMEKAASPKLSAAYSILYKRANAMTAPQFAGALEELDKTAGLDEQWDQGIEDPWKTTFALPKVAFYSFSDTEGYITEVDLKNLGGWKTLLKRSFEDDWVEAFAKDPVGTFSALPLDQKKIVIKFAKVIRQKG